ncbi:hypothetical protein Cni_G17236 [Canna indica]|uniref:Uncharacterized protein n=1 Tax=Canna indica TaxID=4628 RepID=A0AAQ3KKB7_9LILI|nr:hypothetical protein Cni_G17236 [Canna indica]
MMRPAGAVVTSSPCHEKLPATALARILAGSGSRSRGRPGAVRSSPLFSSRSKSVGRSAAATQAAMAAAAAEEGEPTSPKVTCIGQVRIRNKKSSPAPAKVPQPKETRPCQCFHKALLRSLFPARKKAKGGSGCGGRSLWRRWAAPLGGRSGGYQRREPDSPRGPPLEFIVINGEEEEEETRVFAAAPPPKDALLLMRCRSAPHNRASSLATTARCAVSPLPEQEPSATAARDEREKWRGELRKKKQKKMNKPKGNERWSPLEAAAEELSEEDEEEEEEETGSESQRPLVLTRCRSEPATRRRAA